jgi:hypothetical protein
MLGLRFPDPRGLRENPRGVPLVLLHLHFYKRPGILTLLM